MSPITSREGLGTRGAGEASDQGVHWLVAAAPSADPPVRTRPRHRARHCLLSESIRGKSRPCPQTRPARYARRCARSWPWHCPFGEPASPECAEGALHRRHEYPDVPVDTRRHASRGQPAEPGHPPLKALTRAVGSPVYEAASFDACSRLRHRSRATSGVRRLATPELACNLRDLTALRASSHEREDALDARGASASCPTRTVAGGQRLRTT